MGLAKIEFKDIITLHAPLPAPFGEPDPEIEKHVAKMGKKDSGGSK